MLFAIFSLTAVNKAITRTARSAFVLQSAFAASKSLPFNGDGGRLSDSVKKRHKMKFFCRNTKPFLEAGISQGSKAKHCLEGD